MVKAVENSTALAVIGEDWIEQHKDQVRPQTLDIGSGALLTLEDQVGPKFAIFNVATICTAVLLRFV